ncbi:MAG: ABC transporter substrate-binding protein [Pseudochelatococcus sp.]|jgi:polar amino acid transport system substrate-binding protein|uniref:ABC transporter substrate-binding protein n=1 Tax=Pseudochelatococcus sp. TaxID=2020869 RepID=UPI003D8A850D
MNVFKPLAVVLSMACAAGAASSAWAQTLKVGSTPTSVPFSFLDPKTNTINGLMVDIVTEVAKEAGYEVEITPIIFASLIPSLTSKKIDVIAAAMFATDARREVINFTDTVYGYGEALFVPKADTKEYVSFEDLKGEVVGGQIGTTYISALQRTGLFAEVKPYETIPDMIRDVNAGRIKAGFADYPIVAHNLAQGRFPDTRIVESYKPTLHGAIGIGLRKDDAERLEKFNAAIAKLKAEGRFDAIVKKWGL